MSGAIEYPFASVADDRHPLLRIAAREMRPAHSVKVEWLMESLDGEREIWENFTQIVRTPFTPRDDTDRDLYRALDRHLEDVENTLWYGKPSYDLNQPLTTCGGALHYLGRPPLYADQFFLRPLRDLVLLKDRGAGATIVHEFLSEFSLEVRPAPAIRPYRQPTPRPMRQGSQLREAMAA